MKKYKFSNKQRQVVDLSTSYVCFPRGRGATFAVVYGALKYALKNKKSAVMVCGDGMNSPKNFLHRLGEIKKGDWWLSNITIKSIVETSEGILVTLRNKSTVCFTPVKTFTRGYCGFYDVAYVDSKLTPLSESNHLLPYVATKYCIIESTDFMYEGAKDERENS